MTRAYGVAVVGGGAESAGTARARAARGRPNWWVVLAVSLALIAVLVASAGTTPRPLRVRALGAPTASAAHRRTPTGATDRPLPTTTTTTTTTAPSDAALAAGTSLLSTAPGGSRGSSAIGPGVTTTTVAAPTTTVPSPGGAQQPANRSMQNEGYLDPPLQTSQVFAFTGSGATQVSVVWSGPTYLTMVVSCPNDSQSVGGTSAMQATLPDAVGSCRATVTEPSSESTALTFTITIGPAGG